MSVSAGGPLVTTTVLKFGAGMPAAASARRTCAAASGWSGYHGALPCVSIVRFAVIVVWNEKWIRIEKIPRSILIETLTLTEADADSSMFANAS